MFMIGIGVDLNQYEVPEDLCDGWNIMNEIYERIRGSRKVINLMGEWPSFHDAEILNVEFDRKIPSLQLRVYTFLTEKEITKKDYKRINEYVITFRFLSIDSMSLFDFNHQNVIFGLYFKEIKNGDINVVISPNYGLRGKFNCKNIEIVSVCPVTAENPTEKLNGG